MDLMQRRRELMMMDGGGVPYQKVEYLEADGNAYIDMGVHPLNDNSSPAVWEAQIGYKSGSSGRRFLGCYSNAANVHYSEVTPNNVFGCYTGRVAGNVTEPMIEAGTLYDASAAYYSGDTTKSASSSIDINGTIYTQSSFYRTAGENAPFLLFRLNSGYRGSGQRIGTNRLSIGGVLCFELVPVRIGTTGYMYDKVSGQLFGNAGNGDFILGNDI